MRVCVAMFGQQRADEIRDLLRAATTGYTCGENHCPLMPDLPAQQAAPRVELCELAS